MPEIAGAPRPQSLECLDLDDDGRDAAAGRVRLHLVRGEGEDWRGLLLPLAQTQDELARLEAEAALASKPVREGLVARRGRGSLEPDVRPREHDVRWRADDVAAEGGAVQARRSPQAGVAVHERPHACAALGVVSAQPGRDRPAHRRRTGAGGRSGGGGGDGWHRAGDLGAGRGDR